MRIDKIPSGDGVIFRSDRVFRIWLYTAAHSQLLLRSSQTGESPARLELLFKGVCYMGLPTVFESLTIARCDPSDPSDPCNSQAEPLPAAARVVPQVGPDAPRWYRIQTLDLVDYIAAHAIFTNADELGPADPSHFTLGPSILA